jgi:WD40 repeat protein
MLVTVPIGTYSRDIERPFADVDADGEADKVVRLLVRYDSSTMPLKARAARDGAWAATRLNSWATRADPANSLLAWIGHGESDGEDAWLATSVSGRGMPLTGHRPAVVADAIREEWRSRQNWPGAWAIVAVEACGAERFVELVISELTKKSNAPRRLAVIGAGGRGETFLGTFSAALGAALASYTSNDATITIQDLVARIEDRLIQRNGEQQKVTSIGLGDAIPIMRPREFESDITAPQDIYVELRELLSKLTTDEQGHFLPKAQSAEQGELAWYFVGRSAERREIANWLSRPSSGLLVVTGRAGSGKSALLGNLVVHATPTLRDLLIRLDHLDPLPPDEAPGDQAFDAAMLLTGLTAGELTARLADIAGFGAPPSGLELGQRIGWLLDRFRERQTPFTLLTDALDEAQDPFAIAGAILRRLAVLPGCRVIVGTRRSTNEGPDLPDPDDENLLDALGGRDQMTVVTVQRDEEAIRTYVTRRLSSAPGLPQRAIDMVAAEIGIRGREFLYARLAVHELLAWPEWVDLQNEAALHDLLSNDHRALFDHAVQRLSGIHQAFHPLLEALAFSEGRGVPRADRIWITVANALAPSMTTVRDGDIDSLMVAAAPYIMLDADNGQSVYRLAHRTFQEYFLAEMTEVPWDGGQRPPSVIPARDGGLTSTYRRVVADKQEKVAAALLSMAPTERLPPYLRSHLSDHIGVADQWARLAEKPELIDLLDLNRLTAAVLSWALGRRKLPDEVAGAVMTRQLADGQPHSRRALYRSLGHSQLTGYHKSANHDQGLEPVRFIWGRRKTASLSIPLIGHTGPVTCIVSVRLRDGLTLLATGSEDCTVRLWDPTTGTAQGNPLTGPTAKVTSIATVPFPGGQTLLAAGSADGTARLWDPTTNIARGSTLAGHSGGVTSVAAVPLPDGRSLLATGGDDGTVRLWDATTSAPYGDPLLGHTGPITSLAAIPLADGQTLLATGSADGMVRLWDAATSAPCGTPLRDHTGSVTSIAALVGLLATSSTDGTIRLWDMAVVTAKRDCLTSERDVASVLTSDSNVTSIAAVPLADERTLLAVGTWDGIVRLWDARASQPYGNSVTSHTDMTSIAAVPLADERTLLATGSRDGTVRLLDPTAGTPYGTPVRHSDSITCVTTVSYHWETMLATGSRDGTVRLWTAKTGDHYGTPPETSGSVTSVAGMPLPNGRPLLATAGSNDRTVRLWDAYTGRARRRWGRRVTLKRHAGPVTSLAAVPLGDGQTLLATGSEDRTIRLWDPVTSVPHGDPLLGHTGPITSLAAIPLADGQTLLATGSEDRTVRLWDLTTGNPHGKPLGHTDGVSSVAALELPNGHTILATRDNYGSMRIWNPTRGVEILPPVKLADPDPMLMIIGSTVVVAGSASLTAIRLVVDDLLADEQLTEFGEEPGINRDALLG